MQLGHRPTFRTAHQIAVVSTACSHSPSLSDAASTTNPGKPNIAAAALRSRSTCGLHLRVHEHHGS
jgi:hypothetical protein